MTTAIKELLKKGYVYKHPDVFSNKIAAAAIKTYPFYKNEYVVKYLIHENIDVYLDDKSILFIDTACKEFTNLVPHDEEKSKDMYECMKKNVSTFHKYELRMNGLGWIYFYYEDDLTIKEID